MLEKTDPNNPSCLGAVSMLCAQINHPHVILWTDVENELNTLVVLGGLCDTLARKGTGSTVYVNSLGT
jgi:hypothetical protein